MTAYTNEELADRLRHSLLIHTDADDWERAAERSDRDGGGLVLHGRKALIAARYLKEKRPDYSRPVLVDASAYSGKKRKLASDPFDKDWMTQQRKLGLAAVLADGGYLGDSDEGGLVSILDRVHSEPEGTVATLAVHPMWLNPNAGQPTLKRHILDAGVPVALVVEHAKDPYTVKRTLWGLVDLIENHPLTMLLRSDTSAVGALCVGALAAAVGTKTSLRHLYPIVEDDDDKPPPPQASIAVLLRPTLSYVTLDKLEKTYQLDPDNTLWQCGCIVCGGAELTWIRSSPNAEQFAYMHSVEILYDIRDDLLAPGLTPDERRRGWITQCDSAMFQHDLLGERIRWEPPKYLGSWASLPLPQPTV